jgi:hypothetical protein
MQYEGIILRICFTIAAAIFLLYPGLAPGEQQGNTHSVDAAVTNEQNNGWLFTLAADGDPISTGTNILGLVSPARCDREGNLYFRPLQDGTEPAPIVRVSPEGSVGFYNFKTGLENKKYPTPLTFTVDFWGLVYELLKIQPEDETPYLELVTYSADGQYRSAVELDVPPELDPSAFVALHSGNFLIAGKEKVKGPQEKVHSFRSFAAVVAPDGRLVRHFRSPRAGTPDKKIFEDDIAQNYVEGEVGNDGNLYLLRGSLQATIDVVSESGTRIRSISLSPPMRNAIPFDLRLDKDRLLLTYIERRHNDPVPGGRDPSIIYAVFSSQSGQTLGNYVAGSSIKGELSCFQSDRVTFLTTKNGILAIIHASLD